MGYKIWAAFWLFMVLANAAWIAIWYTRGNGPRLALAIAYFVISAGFLWDSVRQIEVRK